MTTGKKLFLIESFTALLTRSYMVTMPLMRLAYGDSIGSYSNLFSCGTFSEGKWIKKLLIKSRAAILMASMPRLAPLVPAPISDGTSISLMFFMQARFNGQQIKNDLETRRSINRECNNSPEASVRRKKKSKAGSERLFSYWQNKSRGFIKSRK